MKHHNIHILTLLSAVASLAACSPASDDYDYEETTVASDQLTLTVKAVEVGGKASNRIIVENSSPCLSEWTLEQMGTQDKVTTKSYDELIATHTGINNVRFRTYNALKNEYMEKTIPVQVDAITEVPQYLADRLCIGQEGAPSTFSSELDFSKIQIIPERDAQGRAGWPHPLRLAPTPC